MPRVKLTDAVVSAALPQKTIYDLNDTETRGLQCIINPRGKKTFKLRVRNFEKKIGTFPIVKCAEARKIALMWYGELIKGDKPGSKKETLSKKKDVTVDSVIQEYLDYKQSGKNALASSTFYDYNWTWKKYISPALGNKLVSQLTDVDINIYFASLKETYSHAQASRVILKPALEYGESMGYAVATLRPDKWLKFKTNKRERYFTAGELKRLHELIAEGHKKKLQGAQYKQLIVLELLVYTGCRCGEILNLRWSDVFLEEGYIQLWKTKTKKGRIIPIGPTIHNLLSKVPRFTEATYVFSLTKNSHAPIAYKSLITLWLSMMKQGKFNETDIESLTIHSLRHTFITVANRSGVSPWTIATLVGHTLGNSVTGIYIHHNLEELTKAQSQIIDVLNQGKY